MKSNINPNNIVIVTALVSALGFYYLYGEPTKIKIAQTPIYGQNNTALTFEDLTVIAKMPFLTFENKKVDLTDLKVDDNIFYVPQIKQPQIAEMQNGEITETVNVEDFAPAELEPIKPDYKTWASNNLKLQMLSNNGVIINDYFYRQGQTIEDEHVFEDGTTFSGEITQIGKTDVLIKVPDGTKIKITLTGTEVNDKSNSGPN